MSRGLEKESREGTEGSRKILCEPLVREYIPRIYLVEDREEYFIVFDPGYAFGNVHVYKQVESRRVDELRKEFGAHIEQLGKVLGPHLERQYLVYLFIKKKFWKEPNIEYELCRCETR